jgi:hypothetical protein
MQQFTSPKPAHFTIFRSAAEEVANAKAKPTLAHKHMSLRSVDRWENEGGPAATYPIRPEQQR